MWTVKYLKNTQQRHIMKIFRDIISNADWVIDAVGIFKVF